MSTVLRPNFPDAFDLRIRAENYLFDFLTVTPPKFQRIFKMDTSQLKEEKGSSLGGYNSMVELSENQDFPYVSKVEGYDWTITHKYFGEKLADSLLARQDDPKGTLTRFETAVAMHTAAYLHTVENDTAKVLREAFTVTTGPDGQYLIDTDHPTSPVDSTQRSNKITTALDANGAALSEMYEKMTNNAFDMAGHPVVFQKLLLVVPPALKGVANQALGALYGNFSNIYAPNLVKQLYSTEIEVVDWIYLGSQFGGSDTAWFLIADPSQVPAGHSLQFYNRIAPSYFVDGVEPTVNQSNGAFEVPFISRWGKGVTGWYHVWGSTGTA